MSTGSGSLEFSGFVNLKAAGARASLAYKPKENLSLFADGFVQRNFTTKTTEYGALTGVRWKF